MSLETATQLATQLLVEFKPEEAQEILLPFLESNPLNLQLLLLLAQAYFQSSKDPVPILNEIIRIDQNYSFEQYLLLGQSLDGKPSLDAYSYAAKLLSSFKDSNKITPSLYNSLYSSCLCAIVELYMTDLCDLDEAFDTCSKLTSELQSFESLESLVTISGFKLVLGELDAARDYISRAYSLVSDQDQDLLLSLTKQLIEVAMFNEAITVLDKLVLLNDEVLTYWYLYGLAYHSLGQDNFDNARDCLKRGILVYEKHGGEEQVIDHVKELYAEIDGILNSLGLHEDDEAEYVGHESTDEENL